MLTPICWSLAAAGLLGFSAPLAMAQPGAGGQVYHLHRGSTYQHGCWGACDCPLSAAAPVRGSFTLHLERAGSETDFLVVSDVRMTVAGAEGVVPGLRLEGWGSLAAARSAAGGVGAHRYVTLDLWMSSPPAGAGGVGGGHAQTFVSAATDEGEGAATVLDMLVSNSETGCPGTRLRIVATPLRTDWNADGSVTVQDLYDYLTDYFARLGDYDGDGRTGVGDLFGFVGDWFAVI